jgi:hypothetical protein
LLQRFLVCLRRKIEDEREACRGLKAAKAAGLTPGAWAREHAIDGRSLNAWRLNLAQGRETRPARPIWWSTSAQPAASALSPARCGIDM